MARHGGDQGGRPKGRKNDRTLSKEAAREALRLIVMEHMREMAEAQIDNAKGIAHLMLRDPKTGKFERVTDEAGIDAALKSDGQAVWIYTKDPSVQAWTDLANRALDKPKEAEVEMSVKVSGTLDVVTQTLAAARDRLSKRG